MIKLKYTMGILYNDRLNTKEELPTLPEIEIVKKDFKSIKKELLKQIDELFECAETDATNYGY